MCSMLGRFLFLALFSAAVLGLAAPATAAGVVVSGSLIDADGDPVAGATVEIFASRSDFAVRTSWRDGEREQAADQARTDEQGTFAVEAPEPGLWILSARAPGHAEVVVAFYPLVESRALSSIELPTAREVTVRVRDTEGEAIVGALVVVRPERTRDRTRTMMRNAGTVPYPRTRAGRTGEDGRVALTVPVGSKLHASATATGYVFRQTEGERGKTVDLVLHAGTARTVVVRGPDGEPRANAVIVEGDQQVPVATTGDDGHATVTVKAAKTGLVAWTVDRLAGAATLEPVVAEKADEPVTVELAAAQEITGTVLDTASRDPIAHALVFARSGGMQATHTDARGRYRLALPMGASFVQAARAGYHTSGKRIEGEKGPTIALEAAGRLAGRVVDRAGEPVPDAEVRSLGPAQGRMMRRGGQAVARSDEQGRFELAPVPVDATLLLEARHEGFAPTEIEAMASSDPAAGSETLEIVLLPGRVAVGTVLDAGDQPITGATVTLMPTPASGQPDMRYFTRLSSAVPIEAETDAEGRYRFTDLAAGRFNLEAARAGFARARVPGVTIDAEEDVTDLGSLVLLDGATLEGRVIDPDGQPLAGAQVVVQDPSRGMWAMMQGNDEADATSAADGRFTVPDLQPGGTIGLKVTLEGFAEASVASVRVPTDEPLEIELEPGIDLAGVVVDGAGSPVVRAMIDARPEGQPFATNRRSASTDAMGRFELKALATGTWRLTATAEGFQKAEKAGLEVDGAAAPVPVRIELERGGVVVGTVTGPDGEPVAGVRITVNEQGERRIYDFSRSMVSSDGEGVFRMGGLPSGRHVLSFEHHRHRKATRDVEITGGEVRLDVALDVGLEVSGRVVDSSGQPVAGAQVSAQPSMAAGVRRFVIGMDDGHESDAEGAFRVAGLEPGSYRVTATKTGYAAATTDAPVELSTASVSGIELRLGRGGTIIGRILGVAFDDLARMQVFAMQSDAPMSRRPLMASVDHDGAFRVENVGEGEWTVYASVGRERSRQANATLSAGGETTVELDFGGGFSLEGTVRIGAEPAAGITLMVVGGEASTQATATTDPQGTYRLEGLAEGNYRITLMRRQAWGQVLATRDAEVRGDEVLDIDIQEVVVRGRIVDAEGLPVTGAAVSLVSENQATSALFGMLAGGAFHTTDDGSFEVTQVSPGSYRLQVQKDGFASASRTIEVAPGTGLSGVEVTLERTAGLELAAIEPDGRPARSVILAVLDSQGTPVHSGSYVAGETGVARVTRIGTGSFTLLVRSEASATTEVAVTVPGPRVQVALPPAGQLRVRIPAVSTAGRAELRLVRAGRPERLLGSFGQFLEVWPAMSPETQMAPVAPGPIEIHATLPDGTVLTGQAVVVAGQEVVLEIE